MWWGGFAVGPAYLAAMIPFMIIPIAFVVKRVTRFDWELKLIIALGAYSILMVWIETIAGQSFPDLSPNPLVNISIPTLKMGNIARNLGTVLKLEGFQSLVPLLVSHTLLVLAVFIKVPVLSADPTGRITTPQ
jgi:hypothetical protein